MSVHRYAGEMMEMLIVGRTTSAETLGKRVLSASAALLSGGTPGLLSTDPGLEEGAAPVH